MAEESIEEFRGRRDSEKSEAEKYAESVLAVLKGKSEMWREDFFEALQGHGFCTVCGGVGPYCHCYSSPYENHPGSEGD